MSTPPTLPGIGNKTFQIVVEKKLFKLSKELLEEEYLYLQNENFKNYGKEKK